ncbi:MAG: septum site-determining protein MinC [Anaerolineae bacterium]
MEDTAITLKGTADGILLKPRSYLWTNVLAALERSLVEAEAFFRGGRLILDVGSRELTQEQLASISALLKIYDIELWAVLSENDKTIHLARSHGILTRLPQESEPKTSTAEPIPPEQQGICVQHTLRSGQSIRYPGHVTLIGDVNPGAEIIAGGNIIVWGAIRGVAHAGAFGDENAIICALDLRPAQIRISGFIGRPPEGRRKMSEPEVARVEDNHIIAEPWNTRG